MNLAIIILLGLLYMFVFVSALLFHEIGHIVAYKLMTKSNIKLKAQLSPMSLVVGTPVDYSILTRPQYIVMNLVGVLSGLLPFLILVASIYSNIYIDVSLLGLYFVGCNRDFINIAREFKNVVS